MMLFGAAVRADHLRDEALRDVLTSEVGSLTAEIEMKWSHIEPELGKFDFVDADTVANFAETHQKRLHGHTLLWHRSVPAWAVTAWRAKADWHLVEAFIKAMTTRYHGVESWDVVNEPMGVGDRSGDLRGSAYLDAFGPGYIARAFRTAREHAPAALLCLNEFGLEYDLPEHRQKREGLVRLLTQLRQDDVPIDAVGIQAHLDLAHGAHFNPDEFAAFLNKLGAMGFQIRISELDVREADLELPAEERDRRVADAVRRFLQVALSNKAVGSVTCWGLTDKYSWLDESGGNRGLPFDNHLRAKPMRQVIADAISSR
jgi:endo-1,4-beta-xylanase